MSASAIPTVPIPLSVEQAEAMEQRQIKKHHVAIVLLHWFNAISWFLGLATGAGLIVSPAYRFAPMWYLQMMEGIFGSRANMLRFHIAVGLTWTAVFLVYAIFGFRNYLRIEVLQHEIGLDNDDVHWLKVRTLLLLGRTKDPLPPQGAYNAGQKLLFLVIVACMAGLLLSGLVIWRAYFSSYFAIGLIRFASLLHAVCAFVLICAILVHIYAAVWVKGSIHAMLGGTVTPGWAWKHHRAWFRQITHAAHPRTGPD